MSKSEPLYNSRVTKIYINYLKKNYPDIDVDLVLNEAGIVNYDGTYVYSLDAETGRINWQNSTSGHLWQESRTGVSVQGHMLIHDNILYLASGTSLSPAMYSLSDGKCLNDPELLKNCESTSPRGWELYLTGDRVYAAGKPFYSHPKNQVFDRTVNENLLNF